MISLFELGINILEMFIVLMFLTFYFGSKFGGIRAVMGFLAGWVVTVGIITFLNTLFIYEAFLGIIFALLYFIYCILFLKGNTAVKLFVSSFINCAVYSIALASALLVSVFSGGNISGLCTMSAERICLIVLSKILLIVTCTALLKFRFGHVIKRHNMLLFIAASFVTELSTVGIMQIFMKYSDLNSELLLAAISVLITNFFIYYVFIKTDKEIEREANLALLKQKIEIDKKNAADIESLYLKACGIHHDLSIHFSTISKLMESGSDKAQNYINSVINNHLSSAKTLIKTGNDCFDALANTKIALCEKHGIKCRIRIMEHSIDILPHDEIAVLFGNLFDNAIEAAKNSDKKIIKLDVCLQGPYLSVFIKNSIDASVLESNMDLNTTKNDKSFHGFGIKNIKRIVDKYNGLIRFDEESGYFICDILIPEQFCRKLVKKCI